MSQGWAETDITQGLASTVAAASGGKFFTLKRALTGILILAILGGGIYTTFIRKPRPVTESPNASQGANSSTNQAPDSTVVNKLLSGRYTCLDCKKSYDWYINDKHLMYWDNKPYIPVGSFANSPNVAPEITEVNLWIEGDLKAGQTEAQYFQEIDRKTNEYIAAGKTYMPIISYPFPKNNASWLLDKNEVLSMTKKWKEYAPLIRKDGLRAITLFTEINCEWQFPEGDNSEIHVKMGELAQQAKQIFGDVPVTFKTSSTGCYFSDIYAGAVNADGLVFDIYPRICSTAGFDQASQTHIAKITSSQKKLDLLWIDFGKKSSLTEEQLEGRSIEAGYEPFASKEELKCHIDRYIEAGFTGFFHGTGVIEAKDNNDFKWLAELKPYIQQKIEEKYR